MANLDARHFDDQRTPYVPADPSEPQLDPQVLDDKWLQQVLEDFAALRLTVQRWSPFIHAHVLHAAR